MAEAVLPSVGPGSFTRNVIDARRPLLVVDKPWFSAKHFLRNLSGAHFLCLDILLRSSMNRALGNIFPRLALPAKFAVNSSLARSVTVAENRHARDFPRLAIPARSAGNFSLAQRWWLSKSTSWKCPRERPVVNRLLCLARVNGHGRCVRVRDKRPAIGAPRGRKRTSDGLPWHRSAMRRLARFN